MSLSINQQYLSTDFQKSWLEDAKLQGDCIANSKGPILIKDPFRCFALPEFLDFSKYELATNGNDGSGSSSSTAPKHERTYLDVLRDELEVLEFSDKKNDLYNFRQSIDLHNVKTPAVEAFKRLFNGQVKSWLQELTGIELNDRVAMTASVYSYGDHLLCHDDELEHRRIAYTFYLTPNWTADDGGKLDLFSSDEKLRPAEIVHSIVPVENMLAFFEVVPKSFHQVSEVTSKDKTRWSINGWFHGAAVERPKLPVESLPKRVEPSFFEFNDLLTWINPDYFDPETQASIRQQFEEKSEIQLHQFLQTDRYDAVMTELKNSELEWKKKGPWNRRHFLSLDDGSQLDSKRFPNLAHCLQLMKSEAIYVLMSQFTNMGLHPLYQEEGDGESESNGEAGGAGDGEPPTKKRATDGAKASHGGDGASNSSANDNADKEEKEPSPCELELRKFEPGSYTVLSDDDFEARDSGETLALNAQLYFTAHEWDTKHGGYTCYIEKDSSDELLTITPCGNSLALVCSEPGIQNFVKYLNRNVVDDLGKNESTPWFVDVCGVYYEARPKTKAEEGNGSS